jgi:hypothetical protein
MAGAYGSNQSPIITQRYLNTSTYVGDPTPGAVVSTSQVSGSIIQSYGGFVGGILTLGKDAANYLTDPVLGQQLYAGNYQYVQFDPNSVNTAVQGQVVFWSNLDSKNLLPTGSYRVTPDATTDAGLIGIIAGIALCNTAKGNYWFIQTAGIAEVKFKSSLLVTTPAVGDLIYVDYTTPSALADDPAATTQPTNAQLRVVLGRAWTPAPKASTISPVFLTPFGPAFYPGGAGGEG